MSMYSDDRTLCCSISLCKDSRKNSVEALCSRTKTILSSVKAACLIIQCLGGISLYKDTNIVSISNAAYQCTKTIVNISEAAHYCTKTIVNISEAPYQCTKTIVSINEAA